MLNETQSTDVSENERSRLGQKRSKPSHNAEGCTEAQLRQLSELERAPCRKFKKRCRKDLNSKEIAEIIAAAKEPFRLHKDIA